MAIRCKECGAAAFGFPSCPICGRELRPRAWTAEPPAPRRRRLVPVAGLVLVLLAVAAGVFWQDRGSDAAPPSRAVAETSAAPTTASPSVTPSPSATPSATPAPKPRVRPARRCWDGSRTPGGTSCPVPRGVQGMAAASPTFVAARQKRQCRPLPDALAASGSLCTVRGMQVRFSWFRTPEQLDARFARSFPSCRTVSYLRVCRGPGGSAVRYADRRFVLEVATQPSGRAVLLRLPFNPSARMLRGTPLG